MMDKKELETLVGMAIGSASMCWENIDKAGVFQSEKAIVICDDLVRKILKLNITREG